MRPGLPLLMLLIVPAGCAGGMDGKWPSLAPRAGEIATDGPLPVCPGCGQDAVLPPIVEPVAVLLPLPAGAAAQYGDASRRIGAIEAKVPAQARIATAVIDAARRDAGRSADADVERSRYEALFLSLSVEERELDKLADAIAGRASAAVMEAQIEELRGRLRRLQAARSALPD